MADAAGGALLVPQANPRPRLTTITVVGPAAAPQPWAETGPAAAEPAPVLDLERHRRARRDGVRAP